MADNSSLEKLGFAGQVLLEKAIVSNINNIAIDIMNQIVTIELFEDLFSPFLTGTLTIYESVDLVGFFPFVGEETLQLSFHTPTVDNKYYRNQAFHIYKMSEMTNPGDRSSMYILHFISFEAIVNINTKLSKTYSGVVSDIARKIITGTVDQNSTAPNANFKLSNRPQKNINIEKTSSTTKFISNLWNPMKCINYITNNAIRVNNKNSNTSNYIFFENALGLNFCSLESLYEQEVSHVFQQNNYSRTITPAGAIRDPELDYQHIKHFSIPSGFDYIDRSFGGMYASQMITVDPITKKYSSRNYHATKKEFESNNHLNDYSLISYPNDESKLISRAQQSIIYMPMHYGNFNDYGNVTNSGNVQQRNSLLKFADAHKISISVFGRTDYTVGQKVYVYIPPKKPLNSNDDPGDFFDKANSGFYLISAIAHTITRESHESSLELIKDSLMVNLTGSK